VEIRLKDGRLLSHKIDCVPGDPSHPITRNAPEAKFRDCVSFAAVPLAPKNIDAAIALIDDIEMSPMSPGSRFC
jgi:aconitate decarboxylase